MPQDKPHKNAPKSEYVRFNPYNELKAKLERTEAQLEAANSSMEEQAAIIASQAQDIARHTDAMEELRNAGGQLLTELELARGERDTWINTAEERRNQIIDLEHAQISTIQIVGWTALMLIIGALSTGLALWKFGFPHIG